MSSMNSDSSRDASERGDEETLEDESEDEEEEEVCLNPKEFVDDFEEHVHEKGYEVIPEYYDNLLILCRETGSAFDWSLRLSTLETVLRAFDSMKPCLAKFLIRSIRTQEDRNDEDEAMMFSDTLSMVVDLVKIIASICEEEINNSVLANIVGQASSCASEEARLHSEDEGIDNNALQCYDILKRKALEMLHSICTFSVPDRSGNTVRNAIRYLWSGEDDDRELFRSIASAIVQFIKHPKFALKSANTCSELREIFLILRPICTEFNQYKAVAWLLVSTTMELRHFKDPSMIERFPFIAAVKSVSVDGDLDRLLYYMYYFAMDELHRSFLSVASNIHIPRQYILFIESMAEIAPYIFFENVAPLLPLLDFDPYTLRSSILSAFSIILTAHRKETQFSVLKQDSAIIRERIMDEIQLHLSDISLHVRSKAVGYCLEMAQSGNVPEIYLRKGLLNAVAERLTEKTSAVRRAAIKFFKHYLAKNPYGNNLCRSYLFARYQKLRLEEKLPTDTDEILKRMAEQFFDSISGKLVSILQKLVGMQSKRHHRDSELLSTPLEEVMRLVTHQLFFPDSVHDALEVIVELYYLGKFGGISLEQSEEEIVAFLLVILRQRFMSVPKECIGSWDENGNVVANTSLHDIHDEDDKELRLLENAFILHDQMSKLLPEIVRSVVAKDLADIREVVGLLNTCCRFLIRGSEAALLRLYRKVEDLSDDARTEVINGIASLFVARKTDGKVDVSETTMRLLKHLKQADETSRQAVEDLFCVMLQRHNYPVAVSHVLFHILETKEAEDRVLAMNALAILSRGSRTFIREHLREFQKYIRGTDTILACEALKALSSFVSILNHNSEEESDKEVFRLRVFDSLFPDIEKCLFKLLLADDDDPAAEVWYPCVRNGVRALFALSSEVDYVISRVLGKAIWYAKHTADLLIAYENFKQTRNEPNSTSYNDRRAYWNIKWQRTLERTLTLMGEIVEVTFVYINNSFRSQLKRVAKLGEVFLESNDEAADEVYGTFNVDRSEVEINFAYEEGVFNLKPSKDNDIEIVGTFPAEKAISHVKQEPYSEKDDENDPPILVVNESNKEQSKANPTTVDDMIRTHVNELLEFSLLEPKSTLGLCLTFVVSCMRTANYCKAIRDAATRTFSKFMLISPHLAERGASFLFTVLCSDEEPHMREYLLTSCVDVLNRFPTLLENYALFIYKMAGDEDASVRLTAILHLTHLLCEDLLKPRGCLSDVAFCMMLSKSATSEEREVAAAACNLFKELSKKGNLLVHVLPDIICRLSRYGNKVPMDGFRAIVNRLLGIVGDKSHDVMIEKLCHRFDFCGSEEALENNREISHYFSYFLSQLNLSEKSLPKMCEFIPHFASFLEDDVVYNDFAAVIQSFIESEPNASAKETAEDLHRKIEYLHKKSSLSEEENKRLLKTVGPINLNVSIERDTNGCPIVFNFEDCDQPVDCENS